MTLNCAFDVKIGPTEFTVGNKYELNCIGDDIALAKDKLVILKKDKTEDPIAYELVILHVKNLDPKKINLEVTSYKAGAFKGDDFVLTDKTNTMPLSGFSFEVKSVIQQGAQPTPFGPYGPWTLSIGWVWWVILAALIGGIIYEAYREIKKWKTRRRLLEELKNYKTARPAYDELHSDLRKLERSLEFQRISVEEFFKTLDRSYRLYLIRELEVPALDWSDTEIVQEVKRQHKKIYRQIKKDLIDYFAEMRKIKKNIKKEDATYLIKGCQSISDKISDLKNELQKSGVSKNV